MPATFADRVLNYVDLDIDVVVWPNGKYDVLDRDDFERNTLKYNYPKEIKERAEESVTELIGMVEGCVFPFET